jgi:NADH:ubiquinone oxidoreductase subunit 4 (subunit M)
VTTPDRPRSATSRRLAQAGFFASALAVFACGWLGMQTNDWRRMVAYAVLAMGAAALATAFSRRR